MISLGGYRPLSDLTYDLLHPDSPEGLFLAESPAETREVFWITRFNDRTTVIALDDDPQRSFYIFPVHSDHQVRSGFHLASTELLIDPDSMQETRSFQPGWLVAEPGKLSLHCRAEHGRGLVKVAISKLAGRETSGIATYVSRWALSLRDLNGDRQTVFEIDMRAA